MISASVSLKTSNTSEPVSFDRSLSPNNTVWASTIPDADLIVKPDISTVAVISSVSLIVTAPALGPVCVFSVEATML